ncbi:MAG: hydantoinase/oxoprolinase family protein [Gemmatimonadota bacterium]
MIRYTAGIDVGGTFTDLVAVDLDSGTPVAHKVLSTPDDQSQGVVAVLAPVLNGSASMERVVHGTTIVTNMLLERRGARVVLCATAGATDLLELRRQERAALYDLSRHHPPPLVPPERVVPVPERVTVGDRVDGKALTDGAADEVAAQVAEINPETVCISLLHSYADATHERLLAAAIREALPGRDVILSSEVLPEIREYERTSTAVCEAYARPGAGRYLQRLAARFRELGAPEPGVVCSNGGMRSAIEASREASSLALSGPAGGVAGAALVMRSAGFRNGLSIDIGGTSADVGLIIDGEPLVEAGGTIAGVPIALPRVLVETVSAGGGSVGWIDEGGALRAGPRSAGAVPGPACYARGGIEATVTDAHVVAGNIKATRLGGEVTLDRALASGVIEDLASRLGNGTDAMSCARALIASADSTMARALRRISVERGIDPRDCVLVAFGGGGPLHACGLAETLGMRRILVPPFAGVLSALGLAVAPEKRTGMASAVHLLSESTIGLVRTAAGHALEAAGGSGKPEWIVRLRYAGQGHELEIRYQPEETGANLAGRFSASHQARYGFTLDAPVESVSVRCTRSLEAPALHLSRAGLTQWSPAGLCDDGGAFDATVSGRAVLALTDATMVIADGWTARALPTGGWLLES